MWEQHQQYVLKVRANYPIVADCDLRLLVVSCWVEGVDHTHTATKETRATVCSTSYSMLQAAGSSFPGIPSGIINCRSSTINKKSTQVTIFSRRVSRFKLQLWGRQEARRKERGGAGWQTHTHGAWMRLRIRTLWGGRWESACNYCTTNIYWSRCRIKGNM